MLYHSVGAVINKQLLSSIGDKYFRVHKNQNSGYARVTTQNLIKYLLQTYDQITTDDLVNNEDCMKYKWDANTPIEIMFCQIDDGQAFATSGNSPYMETHIFCMAYNLAFQSGKMKYACQDWQQRTANNQTWANFVTDFKGAHLDLQHEAISESTVFQAHFA